MFKGACRLAALSLQAICTVTKLVLGLFLISTSKFLILTNAFLNGSVFACSTACTSAAERNKMSEYGTVP